MLTIAHVGHWAVNLLYVAPLAIVVGVLGYQSMKDRRAVKADGGDVRRPPAKG
ncbi:hypothetical protein BH20ACT16_BH20ACT16_04380 [soil metagenome]|jgi:hypothetical protein